MEHHSCLRAARWADPPPGKRWMAQQRRCCLRGDRQFKGDQAALRRLDLWRRS
jgi:hypothetical protein